MEIRGERPEHFGKHGLARLVSERQESQREGRDMFCPSCGAEYKSGITRCHECDVDLVDELPPDSGPEWVEFEEVLSTYNLADIALIKSLLEEAGMKYYFQNENFVHLSPLALPARLMVPKNQAPKTLELLKDVELNYMAISQTAAGEAAEDEEDEEDEDA